MCEFSPAVILFLTLYLRDVSTRIGFWVWCVVVCVDAMSGLGRGWRGLGLGGVAWCAGGFHRVMGGGALWDAREICVSYEVGKGFVGVGEHLVKIVI